MSNNQRGRRVGGRALFYHRDSTGRNDQTPSKYVEWAQTEMRKEGLQFNGSAAAINAMIRDEQSVFGDLYLDYDVKGNLLDRPALNALLKRVVEDPEVSDLFIPLRERLARPHDPEDGMKLEKAFRRAGVTIHFQDCVVRPLGIAERADISELVKALIDYEQAGKFRRDLARKMINAQRNLAEQGFATGGRPPFFLRRWLIDPQGQPVRELKEGEVVRMAGHHVAWLPTSEADLLLALRIIEMLDEMPATKVANILTLEGVPSPDAGRCRKDQRIRHQVSGVWHATTITNTAYSFYLIGESAYGRRSMGEEKRVSSSGPRDLTEADYRDDGKPKVIRNPESEWTKAPAKFKPLVDVSWMKKLLEKLDKRGGTQRGKPRSRDDANNPLGVRVFDMDCGWPMYREPYKLKGQDTFRYKCGAYSQSHGAVCAHNHIDGMLATDFVLGAIQQRFDSPRIRSLVETRLNTLATSDNSGDATLSEMNRLRGELIALEVEKKAIQRNMARAGSDEQYAAISAEFDIVVERETRLNLTIAQLEQQRSGVGDPQTEVAKAMSLLDRISSLASCGADLRAARELFELVNANLFLQFQKAFWGKREVQRVASGVLTFGATPPPIEIYQGRTGRSALKQTKKDTPPPQIDEKGGSYSDGKEDSLGNVSRGDWI